MTKTKITTGTDKKRGQKYVQVDDTIRITFVEAKNRTRSKNWASQDVVRVQAYIGAKGKNLHRGAEIPVGDRHGLIKVIDALCKLNEFVNETYEQR
jgi:hypothetical protein